MNLGEEAKKGRGVQVDAIIRFYPETSKSKMSEYARPILRGHSEGRRVLYWRHYPYHVSLIYIYEPEGSTMDTIYFPDKPTVLKAIAADDPLCMLVSHTGERAIVANIDDVAEHYILLKKAGFSALDIDTYYRVVVNKSGASWTFVCPGDYIKYPTEPGGSPGFTKTGSMK